MLSDLREPVNLLLYGDGGTGKTSALATMANLGKVFVVNAESGLKSKPLAKLGVDVSNIEVFPGPGEEITYRALEEQWMRIREELHTDPNAYAGVMWDSVTEITKNLLDKVVEKGVIRANNRGMERDEHYIPIEDWGTMTEQVRSLVRKYRDLECHFAASALIRRDKDQDGEIKYGPAVNPALQGDLIGWFDIVGWTSVANIAGEDEYRGLFRPHNKYRAKDRFGAMPKWTPNPSFERVVGYIEGDLDVESDPDMAAARARSEKHAALKAEEDMKSAEAVAA